MPRYGKRTRPAVNNEFPPRSARVALSTTSTCAPASRAASAAQSAALPLPTTTTWDIGRERNTAPVRVYLPSRRAPAVETLEFCNVERDGRLLIVTIRRPEVMNALHPSANQELARVFDDFEKDPELWIA